MNALTRGERAKRNDRPLNRLPKVKKKAAKEGTDSLIMGASESLDRKLPGRFFRIRMLLILEAVAGSVGPGQSLRPVAPRYK